MTETHGTDINETISVKDLTFSAQLTIGAAKWIERKTGKNVMEAVASLLPDGEGETAAQNLSIEKLSLLVTALYLSAHPKLDPQAAEAAVDTLTLPELFEVFHRSRALEFEAKNSPAPAANPPAESTGPQSSTT